MIEMCKTRLRDTTIKFRILMNFDSLRMQCDEMDWWNPKWHCPYSLDAHCKISSNN